MNEINGQIMEVIRQDGPLSHREIADRLGRKNSTWLKEKVKRLAASGLLQMSKRKGHNGRPVHLYDVPETSLNVGNLKAEWRQWCDANMPIYYDMWLEDRLKDTRRELQRLRESLGG